VYNFWIGEELKRSTCIDIDYSKTIIYWCEGVVGGIRHSLLATNLIFIIWWLLSWLIYYGGWSLKCYDSWWGSGGATNICGKDRVSPSCWLSLSSFFFVVVRQWMDVVVGERGLLAYDYAWLVARLSSSVFKLGLMVDPAQDPDHGFWPGHRVNLNFF